MPTYKLTYFDIRGRGEAIRYIFKYCEVPFEDHRISFEEWPKVKPTFLYQQLPLLEVDGQPLYQSLAICRYLANKFGIAGKSDWEKAQVDQLAEGLYDTYLTRVVMPLVQAIFSGDKNKTQEEYNKYHGEFLKPFLHRYEMILSRHGTGYFVGDGITWIDFMVAEFVNKFYELLDRNFLDRYPNLKKHHDKIHALPNIKSYTDKRVVGW